MGTDLTQRVRRNTSGENAPARTDADEKAVREEAGRKMLGTQIVQMQKAFQAAMPRGAEATQLVRDAMTCLRQTPKLAECEPQSVLGALMTCAQLGLRPGVLGQAWVLPFWDRRYEWLDDKNRKRTGAYRAQFVIGYQGMIALAYRSEQIQDIVARVVYENDVFEVEYGLDDRLVHKPEMKGNRGEPIAYYAVAKTTTGGRLFFVMGKPDMLEYRDKYATTKTKEGKVFGVWVDEFDAMSMKTTIRQLSKFLPKSTAFASAIEADGTVRVDLAPNPDAMLYGEQPAHDDIDGEFEEGEPVAESSEPAVEEKATRAQLTKVHTQLGKLGVSKDDEKLQVLSTLLKRPVASSAEATKPEASVVIELLDSILKQDNSAEVLRSTLSQMRQQDQADGTEEPA